MFKYKCVEGAKCLSIDIAIDLTEHSSFFIFWHRFIVIVGVKNMVMYIYIYMELSGTKLFMCVKSLLLSAAKCLGRVSWKGFFCGLAAALPIGGAVGGNRSSGGITTANNHNNGHRICMAGARGGTSLYRHYAWHRFWRSLSGRRNVGSPWQYE